MLTVAFRCVCKAKVKNTKTAAANNISYCDVDLRVELPLGVLMVVFFSLYQLPLLKLLKTPGPMFASQETSHGHGIVFTAPIFFVYLRRHCTINGNEDSS